MNRNPDWFDKAGSFSFLLLCLYFILHQVNDYFGLLPVGLILKFLFYYAAGGLLVFLAGNLILRNKYKADFYATFVLSLFFFFGAYHDFVKSKSFLRPFQSYTFNLLMIAILLPLILILVKKGKLKTIKKIHAYIFTVLLILVGWEAIVSGYYLISHARDENDLGDLSKKISKNYIPCDSCTSPDIYFIVFDGFTSTSCLKEEFDYDNSQLDSFLSRRGFYIADKSFSNYAVTTLSIAGTLNLNYLDNKAVNGRLDVPKLMQGCVTIYNNELTRILKKEGYSVNNLSCFDLREHPARFPYFNFKKRDMINQQTLFGIIEHDILWNFTSKNLFTGKVSNRLVEGRAKHENNFITSNLQGLYANLKRKDTSPVFTYCHLMIPHEPFYLNRYGEFNDFKTINSASNKKIKSLYLDQLIYTTKILEQLVDSIQSATKGKAVIILQGDHGFRDYETIEKKQKIFRNLNVFYFPDENYHSLYDSISSVNTFRVVLNKYFGQDFPLLKDSTCYFNNKGFYFERNQKR